ncbi:MAG: hypothetical protein ACOYIF_09695 [Acetivibrionales bacterium]|jgi:CitB family two-component system sensor histidine kinase MalK
MILASKKKHTFSIRQKLLLVNILSIILVMLLSTMLNLRTSTDMHEEYTETNLRNMAFSLSKNNMVISALKDKLPSDELNVFIDAIVFENNGIDVITIADMEGKRIYHIDKMLIGKHFVGGNEKDVYSGKSYASRAVGTKGYQFRYFYPIYDRNGEQQLGFVMTSTLMSNFTSFHYFQNNCRTHRKSDACGLNIR